MKFIVYFGPSARNLGAFDSHQEAEEFITALLQLPDWVVQNWPREEFSIDSIEYKPEPHTIEP